MNRIAVVLHLYYTDLAKEFSDYFKKIKDPYDLYISVPIGMIDKVRVYFPHATIREIENNIGYDFYPFTDTFSDVIMQYDVALKVHGKMSNHMPNFQGWRLHLLNNLLYDVDEILDTFEGNKNLGLLYPDPYHGVIKNLEWSIDFNCAVELLKLMEIPSNIISESVVPDYSAGSMFWFRPQALHQLFGTLTGDVYNRTSKNAVFVGNHAVDGTAAHALERIIGVIAFHNKYGICHYTPLKSDANIDVVVKQLQKVKDDVNELEVMIRKLT